MGKPRTPPPVLLLCGLIGQDMDLLRRARGLLVRRYGPVALESPVWPFDQTDYYREEMGPDLLRWFLVFERPIAPDALAGIKRETNAIEQRIAEDCAALELTRPVNLDPGYIDLGKLVLATTKDRSHRVYLGAGIFAESTLHYVHGEWQPWPWTFPDYRQPTYHEFFSQARQRLLAMRRASDAHDAEIGVGRAFCPPIPASRDRKGADTPRNDSNAPNTTPGIGG